MRQKLGLEIFEVRVNYDRPNSQKWDFLAKNVTVNETLFRFEGLDV